MYKIQDVLNKEGTDNFDDLVIRHKEIIEQLKETSKKKEVVNNDIENQVSSKTPDQYTANMNRMRAANIAASYIKGEDIGEMNMFFISSQFPKLYAEMNLVRRRINDIIAKVEESQDKEEAEKLLQSCDDNLLSLPYADEDSLFGYLITKIKKK